MWLAEELESRVLLSATLLKDTNVDQPSGTLRTLGSINDVAIFAEENGSGLQIFSSDGTSAGTKLLAAMDTATDDAPRGVQRRYLLRRCRQDPWIGGLAERRHVRGHEILRGSARRQRVVESQSLRRNHR